jgi:sugar lactone lactonase YvrE
MKGGLKKLQVTLAAVLTAAAATMPMACGRVARPGGEAGQRAALNESYSKTVLAKGSSLSGAVTVVARVDGESVFVVDESELKEYDGASGALRRAVRTGTHNPGLVHAQNLSSDGGSLVLTAATDNRVQLWSVADGVLLEDENGFAAPVNAIRFGDDLLVAEQRTGSIVRQRKGSTRGDLYVTGMRSPAGLAATASDLWVTDSASGTVLQLVANGRRLAEPIEVASGLQQPEGLAISPDGSLVVVEASARRVSRVDAQTRQTQVIDNELPFGTESDHPGALRGRFHGVAVGGCGDIYIAADRTGEIIRYSPKRRQCQ